MDITRYDDKYFLSSNKLVQIKFGVPYFDVFDFERKDFSVPVAVRGTINVRVNNVEEFINTFASKDISYDDFKEIIMSALTRYIKATVTNIPEKGELPVLQLERAINEVSTIIEEVVKNRFLIEYNVDVTSLDIDAIEINKDSKDYKDLVKVSKKLTLKTILHNARIKRVKDDVEVANQIVDLAGKTAEIVNSILKTFKPLMIKK